MTRVSFNEANAKTATNLKNYCAELGISTEGQNIGAMKQALKEKGIDGAIVNRIASGKTLTTAENEALQRLISGNHGVEPVPSASGVDPLSVDSPAEELKPAEASEIDQKAKAKELERAEANRAQETAQKAVDENRKEVTKAKQEYNKKLEECKKAQKEIEALKKTNPNKLVGEEYKKAYKAAIDKHKQLSGELKQCRSQYITVNKAFKQSLLKLKSATKQVMKVATGTEMATKAEGVKETTKRHIKATKSRIRNARFNQFKAFMESAKGRAAVFGVLGLAITVCLGFAVSDIIESSQNNKDNINDNAEDNVDEQGQTPEVKQNDESATPSATSSDEQDAVATDGTATTPATGDNATATATTATTSDETNVEEELEEVEKVEKQVDSEVKKYSYNPGEAYKVEKGDCLWNIVKGLLADKLHRAPTDAEILQGVRKWVEEDETLAYTDDTHQKVLILPGQEITQIEFDAVA